jgi:hypothetical protein
MDDRGSLTLFVAIVLANALTMIVTVAVAIRRPLPGYRFIAAVAIAAFVAAVHQIITARFGVASLLLSGLLVGLITRHVVLSRRSHRVSSR